jgi:DNA-binding response OmpR family regulator
VAEAAIGAAPVVLVVEDTLVTRSLMRRLLERDLIQVIDADSGETAMMAIETSCPDLVVLDLRLPGISGLDLARWVRIHPDPRVARTILLACSASIQPEVQVDALSAGCDEFLGKPFDPATFVSRIRDLLSRQRPG